MESLTLEIWRDTDGTAELFGTVEAERFCGAGSAWFNMTELRSFCDRLGEYPLRNDAPLSLAGGYWGGEGELINALLALDIRPDGFAGRLRVSVQLAEPADSDDSTGQSRSVRTWFSVGYNDLTRFQSAFAKLLSGEGDQAILASTPV